MVKYIIFAGVISMILATSANAKTEIDWKTDIDQAFEQAGKEEKWVYASFYTNSCPYCVKMDKEVYSRGDVAELLNKFVPLKINAATNTDFASKYHVEAYPTAMVMTREGQVIDVLQGYMPADVFRKKVAPLAEGKNPLEEFERKAAAEPKSATTQLMVGYQFMNRHWYDRSRTYLERGIELAAGDRMLEEEAMRLIVASYLFESNEEKAIGWVEKYKEDFPESEYLGPMYFDLGQIHFEAEEFASAARYFELAKEAAQEYMLRVRANWMLTKARDRIGGE